MDNPFIAKSSKGSIIVLCCILAIPAGIGACVLAKALGWNLYSLWPFSIVLLAFYLLKGYRVEISNTEYSAWIRNLKVVGIPWSSIESTEAVFVHDPTVIPDLPPQRLIVSYRIQQQKLKKATVTLKLLKLKDAHVVLGYFLDKGKIVTKA